MQPLLAEDPQVIGAYRLLGRLGAGGMGRVYLGRSAGGRTVAVKVVHPHYALDEQFRARFRREVRAARRVGGSWTAPVLDADPEAAVPWVATGYVAGPSLTEAVQETGPQPEPTVRALGAGLAEALAAVHALGLVHRDVKPANVLLALDGPRLIDFGIARATDATAALTATGASIGSPGYMAPEQILGQEVTGAADVFSLGAVLAYAASGEPPFPGDSSAALLYRVVHEPPVLGPGLTGELRALVEECLAKAPGERPAPAELAARLAPGGGVRALVRHGWLPAPLLERVSRRAVELLDLEAEGPLPGGTGAPGGFGPQGSSYGPDSSYRPDPSYGPDSPYGNGGAGTPGASGVVGFGPPDPSYGRGLADAPPVPARPETPQDGKQDGKQTGKRDGQAAGKRLALSAAAGGGKAGRHKLSCTVVVSVAAALAFATTMAFVFDLLPGSGGGKDKAGSAGSAASSPSARPSDGGLGADSPAADVPKAFLGSWSGLVRQSDGTPNGTLVAVITSGSKGAYVARTTYSALGVECRSKARLTAATDTRITLEEVSDGAPGPVCTGDKAQITFTVVKDGELAYASEDARGGKPTATLTKESG
ncbi:serine/threonine protein kinase [Streptomyces eurocidicus]|uniref:Serine/threonine protein kinase n=1 Tax=Streptomyces eurocidicus TaxID=66423 RepID=A0A2N8NS28_STREU|nr:serine/threonine-protein kinase [Streptomyces eurocidicus]MBB5122857.1 serine/threonine protein kinase [Streptomyces eurocidicus]MBF6054315.1 protein kinase [Streptomyces eurocidicus]PNE31561.1 serine/threonine protein kinase [Streptomyces eurocidicus]